ncbi:vitamin K epoxide reductase family protein [Roseicella aerolata]|uniref:Vitamin K epoxide reductase family protein n=1 Tax=Roseicella aerolata TaxID=2883479 RepID=A0A9X1IDZ2_9PROT|nr:vitamin K epoxide reductase family protein [Roseicella aerolata]MCB4821548.1 vitamin K epoxide reductase family protein [Roseicella aerolata]
MAIPARQLSRELRTASTPDLRRRRWIFGLSLIGTLAAQIVGLFQMGLLRRLPDPPVGPFDSSRVDASDYGHSRLQMPDAGLMLLTYGVTAALAMAGAADRARRNPALPLALAAKTAYDSATCLKLAQEEWAENRAFCAYCQAATLVSLASFALSLPEAGRALGSLTGRRAARARR